MTSSRRRIGWLASDLGDDGDLSELPGEGDRSLLSLGRVDPGVSAVQEETDLVPVWTDERHPSRPLVVLGRFEGFPERRLVVLLESPA